MSETQVNRNIGPTVAINVTAASSTSVQVLPSSNDYMAYAAFINIGAASCFVNIDPGPVAAPAVIPVPGANQTCIVLPLYMRSPVIYAVPNGFSCTAIGTGATNLYVTPITPA